VAKLAKSLKPATMDLNVAPAQTTTQRKQQQTSDQPKPSSDQPITSSEATATDERAQLFTVTNPKKKQLSEETSVTTAASENDDKPSELTTPAPEADNVVDNVVKSPVEGEETVSDEEEEEILDIN